VLDAGYFYACLDVPWSVCVVIMSMSRARTTEPIEMLFGEGTLVGSRNCALASFGEYDGSICAAAAMRAVFTITVATCL